MKHDTERTTRLQQALTEAHLDAVLSTSPSDVLLLTGYYPVMGASVALFTADGQAHVLLPEDEHDLAAHTSSAHLIPCKPASLHTLTGPVQQLTPPPLTELLQRLKLHHATLGLPLELGMQPASYADTVHFRHSLHTLLRHILPEAHLHAAESLLEDQKAAKTSKELTLMEQGARVAEAAFAQAPQAIQPGLREAEVAAQIQAAFESSPAADPLQRSFGYFFCMSGPNSATAAAAYARTRQRRLAPGDLVMIHANTCADGLWTDITRTYTVGAPTQRQQDLRAAIDAAGKAALQTIRPGTPARDVDAAARTTMQQHGFGDDAFKHATGHGVGFAAAGSDARPRIHPASPDLLHPGMTFNIEPAAYFEGYGGMRHCDVVAVTPTGARLLTNF